jgi:hypothetical protein
MAHEIVADNSRDPLNAVAEAMQTAVRAARDGAADAKESVANALPAMSRFVSRFVYTTSYTLSYGIVFPTMLLVSVVPKENAFVHGLIDGGHAARDMVEEMRHGGQTDETADDESPATHARRRTRRRKTKAD